MKLANYYVDWVHNNRTRKSTLCIIKHMDGTNITTGQSRLHPLDIYSKEEGRKISLQNALNKTDFDKATRTEIWKDYFNRKVK